MLGSLEILKGPEGYVDGLSNAQARSPYRLELPALFRSRIQILNHKKECDKVGFSSTQTFNAIGSSCFLFDLDPQACLLVALGT